jgi:hypothetical protein
MTPMCGNEFFCSVSKSAGVAFRMFLNKTCTSYSSVGIGQVKWPLKMHARLLNLDLEVKLCLNYSRVHAPLPNDIEPTASRRKVCCHLLQDWDCNAEHVVRACAEYRKQNVLHSLFSNVTAAAAFIIFPTSVVLLAFSERNYCCVVDRHRL